MRLPVAGNGGKPMKAGTGIGRHKTLFKYGLKLRGINMPAEDIEKDMNAYNREAFDPPILFKDFKRIVQCVIDWEFK